MNHVQIYYFAIIVAAGIGLLVSIQVIHKRALKKRKAVIDRLKNSETIDTATPLDRPLRSFKNRAKAGVTNRFSIFRRVATFLAFITLLIAVSFPFIDQLPQAFISILVGSAAIITGMAAKPFIDNFLSGIAITASKMLNIGDTILINEQYGTIEDISSTHTIIKLWDWRRLVIPNSTMINMEFVNYTLNDKWQWAHVEFFVSYDSDLDLVKKIAQDAALSSDKRMGIEEPTFWIMETSRDSIKCWLATWATSPIDAWELKVEIRTSLVIGLKKAGIKTHINYHSVENTLHPTGAEMQV
ncbi:mechanosensitive ion channel domain-containing protein [Oceanispirochaeta sp.]|jgi:small-conductance mechanosensitive channel|uniref:mechanosensitive ion channel family protein n=1 Tax=Oceanispirochaeta sp. TaxID=2035350 RepID=UPI002639ECE1|nr:mechanosensitive ion channel domain-containing protein [Oceanispirochaeta sp.]MDA3956335.1 mechanosensitive ion channel [Oceanispirochaeta sp.]